MSHLIIQIGNGLYYNSSKNLFTSYIESATKFKQKDRANKEAKTLSDNGININLVEWKQPTT